MDDAEARTWAYILKNRKASDGHIATSCDVSMSFVRKLKDRIASPNWQEEVQPNVRDYNIGSSDYAKRKIQPWAIWLEYQLNPWDADIVKRILRTKPGERRLDYEKIIHICMERIEQLDNGKNPGDKNAAMAKEAGAGTETQKP